MLYGKGCWGAMLLRGTHGDGPSLGQGTGPVHPPSEVPGSSALPRPSPPPSPLLSTHFPLSASDPFIPEEAAETPSSWAPMVKKKSPLTLAC